MPLTGFEQFLPKPHSWCQNNVFRGNILPEESIS